MLLTFSSQIACAIAAEKQQIVIFSFVVCTFNLCLFLISFVVVVGVAVEEMIASFFFSLFQCRQH